MPAMGIHRLPAHGLRSYVPDSTWGGEVYIRGPLTDDDVADGYSEEDLYDGTDGRLAVVLTPVR